MKLSDKTIKVLKNFSSINQSMLFRTGSIIRTKSTTDTIAAQAVVEEMFPFEFGIYDLNQFLNVLGLVDSPRLDFQKDYVVIGDSTGRTEIKYFYSDIDMLTSPSKDIMMPSVEISFLLDNETINKIKRASSVLENSSLAISGEDAVLKLSVIDPDNPTSNTFSIEIDGDYDNDGFNLLINISNLKMLPGDYQVKISKSLISHFENVENKTQYWIALEKTSTYGE